MPSAYGKVNRLYKYYLTDEMRVKLKRPLGSLITGPPENTMKILSILVKQEAPTRIIAVGDIVTTNMVRSGIHVDVYIIDNKALRKTIKTSTIKTSKDVSVRNPPGAITYEAWETVCEAVKDSLTVTVFIDGEEDLLALPAIVCAPFGSFVVYGQPHRGIVLVRVSDKKRQEIEKLLTNMIFKENDKP